MARQPSHRWPSRIRFDQQGLDQGRGELSAYPCRSASSQTATLARSIDQATRARGGSAYNGEGVRHAILVVEDNPLNRELLCDWLAVEGHEVWSVEDLSAAIRSIEDRPPDAVLLDVQLGDEDGLSLAAWMRKQPKLCHIAVIAVPANDSNTAQNRFLKAGCTNRASTNI